MSEQKLILGLPSKGRLQENASDFFKRAGLKVSQHGGRGYTGVLKGIANVEIAFLSASEIAGNLESGSIHFGVTGEDLIREKLANPAESVELIQELGFGHADVVVAVPQSWIDVTTMADLDDVALAFHQKRGKRLRVATKYFNLTRGFFASHGINDYRIVESLGATEGAPAAGSAEVIVDITSTGATLAANSLKILDDGVMLKSQANLVASLTADWHDTARAAAQEILSRIEARQTADTLVQVSFELTPDDRKNGLGAELAGTFDCRSTNWSDEEEHAHAVMTSVMCPRANAHALAMYLRERGKASITVSELEAVYTDDDRLFAQLLTRLGA